MHPFLYVMFSDSAIIACFDFLVVFVSRDRVSSIGGRYVVTRLVVNLIMTSLPCLFPGFISLSI